MIRHLVLVLALSLVTTVVACGGDAGDDDAGAIATSTPTSSAEPAPGGSFTGAQLCERLSADEVSGAVGEAVTSEPSNFDGCHYTGPTLTAKFTETVFTADEYAAYMPTLTSSWVSAAEPGKTVLAYTGDGLVMDAWFKAGEETFVFSVPNGLGESVVLALIAAAQS